MHTIRLNDMSSQRSETLSFPDRMPGGGGGGTLGISGWGCAAGTLEPLAYTRASSAEFCYPVLEQTPTDFRLNTDT